MCCASKDLKIGIDWAFVFETGIIVAFPLPGVPKCRFDGSTIFYLQQYVSGDMSFQTDG